MSSLSTSGSFPAGNAPHPASLAVALAAACAGALVWAAVAYFTGYEAGYVAWGVGGLVGIATARFGGRGAASAGAAALLTLAGIAGGKLLGTYFAVEKELAKTCEETFTPGLHAELQEDAADFAQIDANAAGELELFMVEHRYTPAGSPEEVQAQEVQEFLATTAVELRALSAKPTSFEDWYAAQSAEFRNSFEADFSIVQANIDELNGLDLLFAFLGVSTAFGIVRKAGEEQEQAVGAGDSTADERDVRKAA
jgi:hypothetical protein